MRYPPQVLDQIKSRLNIVEEVRKVVPDLKKKGGRWWGCCPFHSEKSPSFTVNETGPRGAGYHCFGCGAHGDVFTFTMETQGGDFMATIKLLAGRAGVKLPELERSSPEQASKREQGFQALERAAAFWRSCLGGSPADAYLQRRAISPATQQEFGLGFSPDGWSNTRDALTQQGFGIPVLKETGLITESDKPGQGGEKKTYDRFRGRLMFPIHDLQGRTVAFGGRILEQPQNAAAKEAFGPKYLNSPETPFFSKSFLLYNLHRARNHMRQSSQALLVEGYMDVIALWQAGIKTAVAPMGTSVTEDQLNLLWQQVDKPTVCLDGDAAGRGAAIRVANKVLPVLEPGRSIQFVWLPDGEDPDSLIRKDGLAAFQTLLTQATSLEEVLWQHVSAGHDLAQADARATIEGDLKALLNTIRNATVRKAYGQALRNRLWQATRPSSGGAGGGQRGYKNGRKDEPGTFTPDPAVTSAPLGYHPAPVTDFTARILVALILRWPDLLPMHAETVAQFEFPPGDLNDLTHALLRGFAQGQVPQTLVTNLQAGLFAHLISDLLRTTGVNAQPDDVDPNELFQQHAALLRERQQTKQLERTLADTRQHFLSEDKWSDFVRNHRLRRQPQ